MKALAPLILFAASSFLFISAMAHAADVCADRPALAATTCANEAVTAANVAFTKSFSRENCVGEMQLFNVTAGDAPEYSYRVMVEANGTGIPLTAVYEVTLDQNCQVIGAPTQTELAQ